MLPVLTIINDFVGIIGGNIIASLIVGLPTSQYWRTVWEQIVAGRIHVRATSRTTSSRDSSKPLVFGAIISITACYFGLRHDRRHGRRRPEPPRKTVVTSSILILVVDYFLTQILLVGAA